MRLRNSVGKRVPYNECVDWFSLGCILYEFLLGMSPFRTERAMEWCADTIQDKVIGWSVFVDGLFRWYLWSLYHSIHRPSIGEVKAL